MVFAKEIDGKWYGWNEMAEESMVDIKHVRKVKLSNAVVADSLQELEEKIGWSEYGITTQPYLAKDGIPIEVSNE